MDPAICRARPHRPASEEKATRVPVVKLHRHEVIFRLVVNVYVQCTLIWKYIKCMRILTTRILFACCHVISTIFGMKLTAR